MIAPKKLYLSDFTDTTEAVFYAKKDNTKKTDVEYTRTDAFIEEACEGIEHLLSGYIIRNFHFGDSYKIDTLIEDFKNYMKGE